MNYPRLSQAETLIIFGNVTINSRALEMIVGHNINVMEIVLGNNVTLTVDGNPDAWQPHFADGSVWKYDNHLHKLSRKNY